MLLAIGITEQQFFTVGMLSAIILWINALITAIFLSGSDFNGGADSEASLPKGSKSQKSCDTEATRQYAPAARPHQKLFRWKPALKDHNAPSQGSSSWMIRFCSLISTITQYITSMPSLSIHAATDQNRYIMPVFMQQAHLQIDLIIKMPDTIQ